VSALGLEPFPEVELPDLEGSSAPLVARPPAGRTLVAVGHSDCATTRLLVPYLQRMHDRRVSGSSVVLVLQDGRQEARAFLADLHAGLPVRLESEPYPLARALRLETVPTLCLVGAAGLIEGRSEGFERAAIEDLAARLGVAAPFFLPDDRAPALRPG
jgi:hypothetical protein